MKIRNNFTTQKFTFSSIKLICCVWTAVMVIVLGGYNPSDSSHDPSLRLDPCFENPSSE
jgi:hypothetical protein